MEAQIIPGFIQESCVSSAFALYQKDNQIGELDATYEKNNLKKKKITLQKNSDLMLLHHSTNFGK